MTKVILVVGANGEIGSSLVRSVSSIYQVISLVSPRTDIEAFRQKLNLSRDDSIMPIDLSAQTSIRQVLAETKANFPNISALVTCSGVATGSHSLMTTDTQLIDAWNINFLAPVLITQLVSRGMLRKKHGKIIHLASIQGIIAEPGNLAYGSSKAALIHACRVFARELGPSGITVNTICPTVINSKMGDAMDEVSRERLLRYSANGGNAIRIDEVIQLIKFLLSVEGTSMNGQVLRVDAGMPF